MSTETQAQALELSVIPEEVTVTQASTSNIFEEVVVKSIQKALADGNVNNENIEYLLTKSIDNSTRNFLSEPKNKAKIIKDVIKELIKPTTLKIKIGENVRAIPGIVHYKTPQLIQVVSNKIPVIMVGMPGTGKTTTCEKVAEALGLSFHAISIGMQTTKTDILGFIDANGKYNSTAFRKAFEDGGIFLMDEVDAGNPNVLIQLNSAISNGFVEFPDKMVLAHENFRFVCTANTYGDGSNNKFVGRNKLDSATLDRFVMINWDIDNSLEESLCNHPDWLLCVRNLRLAVSKHAVELIVSPRLSIYGAKLLALDIPFQDVMEMTVYKGADLDTRNFIKSHFRK